MSPAEITRILQNFNDIGEHSAQNVYLQALVKVLPVDQKRKGKHKRKFNFSYEVHVGDKVISVCREGFASLHGIGAKRVRNVAALKTSASIPRDNRGKHKNRKNKLPSHVVQNVDDHIQSFPYNIVHYGPSGERRRYLSSQLSVLKMYEMFLEKYYPEVLDNAKQNENDLQKLKCEVKYSFYLKYFRDNYNYSFGRPRSDICTTCSKLEAKISHEKNEALKRSSITDLKVHKQKAKLFYMKMQEYLSKAKENENTEVLCFDFKQNIPCPHLCTSDVFYKRQLWLYCMSVYSGKKSKSIMYTWSENVGKRGCNEVLSVLLHYMDAFLPSNIKNLYVFTDGCRGQNHNQNMLKFWQSMVLNEKFDTIQHFFPQRGHSFLPCDRHFAIIEKMQRKREIVEAPSDWNKIISSKFTVVELNRNMIKDFVNGLAEPFFKKSFTTNKVKFQITKYKLFEFRSDSKYAMFASPSLNGFCADTFSLVKPGILFIPLPKNLAYTTQLPINDLKLKNIKELCKFLKDEDAIAFYGSLTSAVCRHDDEEEVED